MLLIIIPAKVGIKSCRFAKECVSFGDLSALGAQTRTIKIAMAGTQHCWHRFIPLLVYGFYIIKCTRSVINKAIAFVAV